MPCCEISDCAQVSKTIIAVRNFGLGGRESLETAVKGKCVLTRLTKPIRVYTPVHPSPLEIPKWSTVC